MTQSDTETAPQQDTAAAQTGNKVQRAVHSIKHTVAARLPAKKTAAQKRREKAQTALAQYVLFDKDAKGKRSNIFDWNSEGYIARLIQNGADPNGTYQGKPLVDALLTPCSKKEVRGIKTRRVMSALVPGLFAGAICMVAAAAMAVSLAAFTPLLFGAGMAGLACGISWLSDTDSRYDSRRSIEDLDIRRARKAILLLSQGGKVHDVSLAKNFISKNGAAAAEALLYAMHHSGHDIKAPLADGKSLLDAVQYYKREISNTIFGEPEDEKKARLTALAEKLEADVARTNTPAYKAQSQFNAALKESDPAGVAAAIKAGADVKNINLDRLIDQVKTADDADCFAVIAKSGARVTKYLPYQAASHKHMAGYLVMALDDAGIDLLPLTRNDSHFDIARCDTDVKDYMANWLRTKFASNANAPKTQDPQAAAAPAKAAKPAA